MPNTTYHRFHAGLKSFIPESRLATDPLRTLAYGTDASFYRLIPKVVVKADDEREVSETLKQAGRMRLPVTFRAAGTSLSGQAIGDSVLLVAGESWQQWDVMDNGEKICLAPGIIGARANQLLAPFGRKIGPDPASINAAMIGGIAANNASGMCCGTAQNSYQTVDSIRIVLADGTILDTGDASSKAAFRTTHAQLLERLDELARRVKANAPLAQRISRKFKIKNTTGYSLNALVDFHDPFDIITHLMIGSEGTLAFISRIVYRTVAAPPFKATALMIFPQMEAACLTAEQMQVLPVAAAELMDRAALASVEAKPGMPAIIRGLSPTATGLLVETQATAFDNLAANVEAIADRLKKELSVDDMPDGSHAWQMGGSDLVAPATFTDNAAISDSLWKVRKGLLPSVGAVRRLGSTVIIEDVAFPIHHLAPATLELQRLLDRHGYGEAIIFGHALAGNLHFVFSPDLGQSSEVDRYARFMDDIARMVVDTFDGSLKAEHGTGRNMAPFVEKEWGKEAYQLMKAIKAIFDPYGLLNPGVILNANPKIHLENLKPLPPADPLVDACMECGFCECRCPSRNLSLTPRQRIVIQREIARLERSGETPSRLAELKHGYTWQGDATCAADGLCGVACPVDVDTGKFTKTFRSRNVTSRAYQWLADQAADHFGELTTSIRAGLGAADRLHHLLGTPAMNRLARAARRLSGARLPAWLPSLPRAADPPDGRSQQYGPGPAVVYFPACVSRTMGPGADDPLSDPLHRVIQRVLERAGYRVIYPRGMHELCCGLPFESKGFFAQADRKGAQLEKALLAASKGGQLPVLCDTSPCLERMRRTFGPRLSLFEPVEFIARYLLSRLTITRVKDPIALHITCSARKMNLEETFMNVAKALAETVVVPHGMDCCGFAGDRGFSVPELNASALSGLKAAVAGCSAGYANSRTCEIGLSHHGGIPYRSIMMLVDQCTTGCQMTNEGCQSNRI